MTNLAVSPDERRRHRLITRLAKAGRSGLKRRELIRCGSSNERSHLAAELDQTLTDGVTEFVDDRWRLTAKALGELAWIFPSLARAHRDADRTPEPPVVVRQPDPAPESTPDRQSFWELEHDAIESTRESELEPAGFWA